MVECIHFLPSLTVGGAPINVLRAVRWLSSHQPNYRHKIFSPLDNDKFEDEFIKLGANVNAVPKLKINAYVFFFFFSLFFKLKKNGSHNIIIILHGRGCGLMLKPLAIIFRLHSVHFFRGFTPTYGINKPMWAKFLILYDWILARFGTCVAVGTDEYKQILRVLNPTNLIIVRNPVPKIVWELNDNPFDFGFVGRRSYQKGFDLALKICKENPTSSFVWIGDEERNQYREKDIPRNLTLMKYKPQHEIFSMVKTILCVSRWEGCSTVATECVNSKKPFISLHCTGISEFCLRKLTAQIFMIVLIL